ncbi:aldo/keto reductase [Falsirhodobacter algicola]|uniref:Aldo/keto reductase n=1 Tax=Falsirhodobacter algicola TaxID=2692330 RepID=A0A8J8SKY8_9RHOB|nr:aldo/keto reductase [Falsirhodobacter algicola]QUS36460.1 aldo/keto reductase [Falsirhodobacter algicola]
MQTIRFPDGRAVPTLGLGTWMLGEGRAPAQQEIEALQAGIDLGMTLVDTAEMYGDGATERLVGHALKGRRDEVFLVSKAYPQNASRTRLPRACEESLRRLGTDRLDLYLLHWRGGVPLAETVEAMEALVAAGKIGGWGVSNLDPADMEELVAAGGASCQTNQILYNLTRRGPDLDLLPWMAARALPAMAYSPVEQGRLLAHPGLSTLAEELDTTPVILALAWVLEQGLIAIPKASTTAHVAENRKAAALTIPPEARARLEALFPPPPAPVPLEMI